MPAAPRWWVGGEVGLSQVIRPFGRFGRIWASGKGCRAVSLLGQDYRAVPVSATATELRDFPGETQRLGGLALAETGLSPPQTPRRATAGHVVLRASRTKQDGSPRSPAPRQLRAIGRPPWALARSKAILEVASHLILFNALPGSAAVHQ